MYCNAMQEFLNSCSIKHIRNLSRLIITILKFREKLYRMMLKNALRAGLLRRKPIIGSLPTTKMNLLSMSQVMMPAPLRFKSSMNEQAVNSKVDTEKDKLFDNGVQGQASAATKDAVNATMVKQKE